MTDDEIRRLIIEDEAPRILEAAREAGREAARRMWERIERQLLDAAGLKPDGSPA